MGKKMQRIGFIGLGLMGHPMAANVAKAGYPLTVYNRTPAKAEGLIAAGARVAGSPSEVAEASQVVITMLTDAAAVEAVLSGPTGLLAGGQPGSVLIDMSTVAPEQSRRIAAGLAAQGWMMLDAPVFGSTGPATEGTLGILVGGDEGIFEAQRGLLETMGKHVFYFGPQGSGATAKLAFNLMVAAQVASLAEAMVLAAKGGLDLALMAKAICASPVASMLVQRKVGSMVANDFPAAFPLRHMHKDLGLMVGTSHAIGAPMPATASIHQLYTAARARGLGEEDFAAIFRLLVEMAGMPT
jgi:3-hydroxyisobutyrate dehydrogenase